MGRSVLTNGDDQRVSYNVKPLQQQIGDLTKLGTTDKTSLVNALNEVKSEKEDSSLIGNLTELNTSDKSNLVAAINSNASELADVVHMGSFPIQVPEVDDTARLQRALSYYGASNRPYKIILDGTFNISDTLSTGSYCVIDGNHATINMSDSTKEIFKCYGYEVMITGVNFVGGLHAIDINNPNIDKSVCWIENCYFTNQSDYQIITTGANSQKLTVKECKFTSYHGVANVSADNVLFEDCWVSANGDGISYFKSTQTLTIRNSIFVPSLSSYTQSSTYWIENNGFYLKCDNVRFSGESAGFKVLNHIYTNNSGYTSLVHFESCYFWGGNSGVSLSHIPNNLIIEKTTTAGSPLLSVVGTPTLPKNYTFNVDIGLDTSAYYLQKETNNNVNSLNYNNVVGSNSYFNGFAGSGYKGSGGSSTNTADIAPFGNLVNLIFGTNDQRLYQTYSKDFSSLTGVYTAGVVIKADKDLLLQITVGKTIKYTKVSANDKLSYVFAHGYLDATNYNVTFAIYDPQPNTNITWGSPYLFKGIVNPKQTTPTTTTLNIVENILGMPSASAIPTDGYWYKGAILYNSNPVAGGYMGWVCTTTGTPGTWKGFGLIQT